MWKLSSLTIYLLLCAIQVNSDPNSGLRCGVFSRCVLQWYCTSETVNIFGKGIIDFRSAETKCPHYLQVCCHEENILEPAPLPTPVVECGKHNNANKIVQIVNGIQQETDFPEFPWVVAIFSTASGQHEFLGGGSIVAPNAIITAAHIIKDVEAADLVVRAGEWDMQTENEPLQHKNCPVKEKIIHNKFNTRSGAYDAAVLVLQTPLELTYHIMPICLPRAHEFMNLDRCIAAGWGKPTLDENVPLRNIMRKVDLPIVNNTRCQELLRRDLLGRHYVLDESLMCAGGEKNLDVCRGDGGSPLFCPLVDHPQHYFQLGIVSWGLGCNKENVPGVYVNLFLLQTWLRDILKALSVDPNYYTPRFTTEYYDRELEQKREKY